MIPLHAAVSRIERVGTEPDRNPAEFRRIVLRLIDTGPRRLRIAFDHRRKVTINSSSGIIHGQRFGYGRLIHLTVAADRRHVRIEHVLRQLLPLGLRRDVPSLGADAADRSLIGRRLRFPSLLQNRLPVIEGTVNFQGLGAELCILIIIRTDIVARLRIRLYRRAVRADNADSPPSTPDRPVSRSCRHCRRGHRSWFPLREQRDLPFDRSSPSLRSMPSLRRRPLPTAPTSIRLRLARQETCVFDLERHVGHLRNDYASHFQNDLFDLADRSDTPFPRSSVFPQD